MDPPGFPLNSVQATIESIDAFGFPQCKTPHPKQLLTIFPAVKFFDHLKGVPDRVSVAL
jgi:hypothetical protein